MSGCASLRRPSSEGLGPRPGGTFKTSRYQAVLRHTTSINGAQDGTAFFASQPRYSEIRFFDKRPRRSGPGNRVVLVERESVGFFEDFRRGQQRGKTPKASDEGQRPVDWTDPRTYRKKQWLWLIILPSSIVAIPVIALIVLVIATGPTNDSVGSTEPDTTTVGSFSQCVERVKAKTTREWLQETWDFESPNTIAGAAAVLYMVEEVCREYAGTDEPTDLAADRVGLRLKESAE